MYRFLWRVFTVIILTGDIQRAIATGRDSPADHELVEEKPFWEVSANLCQLLWSGFIAHVQRRSHTDLRTCRWHSSAQSVKCKVSPLFFVNFCICLLFTKNCLKCLQKNLKFNLRNVLEDKLLSETHTPTLFVWNVCKKRQIWCSESSRTETL